MESKGVKEVSHFIEPTEEIKECIDNLCLILKRYIRIIDSVIAITVGHPSSKSIRPEETPIPDQISQVSTLLFQALGSSSNTVLLLSESPGLQTRDCLSIARSIIETAINICFIIAEGPEVADKALRHARQKSSRDMNRRSRIGDSLIQLKYLAKPDINLDENIQQEIQEYTSRSGREKGWIDISIDKRIEKIGQKYGYWVLTNLHMARFGIYRHSSEILHGTLFGVMYFYGMTSPASASDRRQDLKRLIGHQHIGVLIAIISVLSVTIEVFHNTYGFKQAKEKSSELIRLLKEVPFFQEKTEREDKK